MKKRLSKDAIVIKKLRQIKSLNRNEASILLGISPKTIESFENGRNRLTEEKLVRYSLLYGFTKDDLEMCLNDKMALTIKKYAPKLPKVIEHNALRRSYKKIVTKESKVLQVLRKLKGLTQYQASAYCGYSKSAIGHIEHGRIELAASRIKHIVESYGYTMKDFEYHLNSEVFVTQIQDDCINIIKKLSEEKLKAVYPLLSTFK